MSWKELPVVGSFFRQRRVAIGFDQSAPASLQRTKLLTPSVATAGVQGAAHLPVVGGTRPERFSAFAITSHHSAACKRFHRGIVVSM
jgi:hypothetical protein